MELLCKCEKPIYFAPVVNMILPKFWKRETSVYCDCGSVINVKIKKYFSERDYRLSKKYSGRDIYESPFSLSKFDVKLMCACSNPVIISGTHWINKTKILKIICSNCKSLYEIQFVYYNNLQEFETRKQKKIFISPKPSIETITNYDTEKNLILKV